MPRYVFQFATPGYIAEPYWPEMYKIIEIQKQSGMMRARSEANRRRALEEHLRGVGMTYGDYLQLEKDSKRPFYTNSTHEIIIPADRLLSCLVNACDVAPAKIRVPNVRSCLHPTDFHTGKLAPDGTWERFAVVTGAQGKLSNQRGFRASQYIREFDARGTIDFSTNLVSPEAVLALLTFAGREVGIGASRKMGWGRFAVIEE